MTSENSDIMKLSELARRLKISPRTLKKHLRHMDHYRLSPRSPIMIRRSDFEAYLERVRRPAQEDPDVRAILERVAAMG